MRDWLTGAVTSDVWLYGGRCIDCLPGEDFEDDGCYRYDCGCWCHDDNGDAEYDDEWNPDD